MHQTLIILVVQGKGGVLMFGGCIADRVLVNEEEVALADVRGFATVQFSPNSFCRYKNFVVMVPFPELESHLGESNILPEGN